MIQRKAKTARMHTDDVGADGEKADHLTGNPEQRRQTVVVNGGDVRLAKPCPHADVREERIRQQPELRSEVIEAITPAFAADDRDRIGMKVMGSHQGELEIGGVFVDIESRDAHPLCLGPGQQGLVQGVEVADQFVASKREKLGVGIAAIDAENDIGGREYTGDPQ